jgi:iron complex transport system substrate-binding protein
MTKGKDKMGNKKITGLLGALLALMFIFSGCSSAASSASPSSTATNASAASSSGSAATQEITDIYGRKVQVPKEVKKIAAIGGAARLLTYAGCADKLVGVTDMDKKNVPDMPYSVVNAGYFKTLTSVGSGGANDTCYTEALATLKPDVIFGMSDSQNTIEDVQKKTGIPTIGLNAENMFDKSFYTTLEIIGQTMGTQDHCTKVIDYIKGCQKDLDDRTKGIADAEKPSVYSGAVSFRGAHGFEGTYGNYPPFTAIHAKNVVDETGKSGAMLIDLEKVSTWNPDIIFLNPSNMNLVNEQVAKNKTFYKGLKAVQKGNVYSQISYNYNWTNMEIAIADTYYAGKVIYPKQFSDVDPVKKADEIFTTMLGQPFYSKLEAKGYKFGKISIGE